MDRKRRRRGVRYLTILDDEKGRLFIKKMNLTPVEDLHRLLNGMALLAGTYRDKFEHMEGETSVMGVMRRLDSACSEVTAAIEVLESMSQDMKGYAS